MGYTSYYFYEFSQGFVTYRRLAGSPDEEASTILLGKSPPELLRKQILADLFKQTDVMNVNMRDLTLPIHPGKSLKIKKLKSLAKKFFSIPTVYLKFYPPPPPPDSSSNKKRDIVKDNKRKKSPSSINSGEKKRWVGRPKKVPVKLSGLQSVTRYFRVIK